MPIANLQPRGRINEVLAGNRPAERKPTSKDLELNRMGGRMLSCAAWLRKHKHDGRIVLPLPPNFSNPAGFRGHWATEKEIKDAYRNHCDAIRAQRLIPAPPSEPAELTRCRIVLYTSREMDLDNANHRRKVAQDWLKTRGYIKDDSPKHFDVVESRQERCARVDVRIEFELMEVVSDGED